MIRITTCRSYLLIIILVIQCSYFSYASDQKYAWFWSLLTRGQIRTGSQEWLSKNSGSTQQYLELQLWESEPFQLGFERVPVESSSPLESYTFQNLLDYFSLHQFSMDVCYKVDPIQTPTQLMIFGRFPSAYFSTVPLMKQSNATLVTTGYWKEEQIQFNDPSKPGDVCEYRPFPTACTPGNDPGKGATAFTAWPRGLPNQLSVSQLYWRIASNAFTARDSFYFLLSVFGIFSLSCSYFFRIFFTIQYLMYFFYYLLVHLINIAWISINISVICFPARQVSTSLSFSVGTTPVAVQVPFLDVYSLPRVRPGVNLSSLTPAGVRIDERLNEMLVSPSAATASAGSATVLRLGGPPVASCSEDVVQTDDDVARTRCPPVLHETHEFLVCVTPPPTAPSTPEAPTDPQSAPVASEQQSRQEAAAATRLQVEARCEYPCAMASRQPPTLKWLLDGKVRTVHSRIQKSREEQ